MSLVQEQGPSSWRYEGESYPSPAHTVGGGDQQPYHRNPSSSSTIPPPPLPPQQSENPSSYHGSHPHHHPNYPSTSSNGSSTHHQRERSTDYRHAGTTAGRVRASVGMLPPDAPRSYTPVKLVGDGSFGTVWLCDWHSPLPPGTTLSPMQCGAGARPEWAGKRLVAVKRMKRVWERGWDEAGKLKELESLRTIPFHPNVIPLYDAFLQPKTKELYFVFECMEGNLYQLTKSRKGRPLAGGLIASIFHQVISGLAHIHSSGYFHRDMKPENLLVTTIGLRDYDTVWDGPHPPPEPTQADVIVMVKLADFGLAREIASKPPYTEYVSTRWYRAPEVLLRSRDYGPPVDLWALGTILAEIITLKPIFPGQSEVDQVFKICAILGDPSPDYGFDERGRARGGGNWDEGIRMARGVGFGFPKTPPVLLASYFPPGTPSTLIDCIADCLRYDPRQRITAQGCLDHPYFVVAATSLESKTIIPPMPDAPAIPPTRSSVPTLLPSATTSTSHLVSPPDSGVVQNVPPRDAPLSHSQSGHGTQSNRPATFSMIDSANRTLPPPQPSTHRLPYYPYRDNSSPHSVPGSPSSSFSLALHPQMTVYDSPSLDTMLAGSLGQGSSSARLRTSGASALVDQLRELDLPSSELSSYGRRGGPPPSGGSGLGTRGQYTFARESSSSGDLAHPPLYQRYAEPHAPNGATSSSASPMRPAFDKSSGSVVSSSSSLHQLDNPSNGASGSRPAPPMIRTPYDDELSAPPPPALYDNERVRRGADIAVANAQVEAAKRAALAAQSNAGKKKKWALSSVFGGNNDSKLDHLLPSVGEEVPVASGSGLSLKRTQSALNGRSGGGGGGGGFGGDIDMADGGGGGGYGEGQPSTLLSKANAKEAKKLAKQLELARREAAAAAQRERARAVMQKRERLAPIMKGAGGSGGGNGSIPVSNSVSNSVTGEPIPVISPVVRGGAAASSGFFGGRASSTLTLNKAPDAGKGKSVVQTDSQTRLLGSEGNSNIGSSSSLALGASASNTHLASDIRESPALLFGADGNDHHRKSFDLMHRHKSRRRDGDDDHSMSSHDAGASLCSPSVITFLSDRSDPGPRQSARQYPSSLAIGRTASISSHGSASSPQLFQQQHHHQSPAAIDAMARDFTDHARLGTASSNGAGGRSPAALYAAHASAAGGLTPTAASSSDPYDRGPGTVRPFHSLPGLLQQQPGYSSSGAVHPMFQVSGPPISLEQQQQHSPSRQPQLPPFSYLASVADQAGSPHHSPS